MIEKPKHNNYDVAPVPGTVQCVLRKLSLNLGSHLCRHSDKPCLLCCAHLRGSPLQRAELGLTLLINEMKGNTEKWKRKLSKAFRVRCKIITTWWLARGEARTLPSDTQSGFWCGHSGEEEPIATKNLSKHFESRIVFSRGLFGAFNRNPRHCRRWYSHLHSALFSRLLTSRTNKIIVAVKTALGRGSYHVAVDGLHGWAEPIR